METALFFATLFAILVFTSKDWKMIRRVAGSWGVWEVFGFFYDFPFWLWMQHRFGEFTGSVYASLIALVINFVILVWYQSNGTDWLGVNVLEQLKREGEEKADNLYNGKGLFLKVVLFIPAMVFKLVIWSLNKTELVTFFTLSIFTDSFLTTVFMRRGRFGKLDRRDMKIFLLSTLISCASWSVFVGVLAETFHFLFSVFGS